MFGTSVHGLWWGAWFTSLLLIACVTDIRARRIPNALVLVLLLSGVVFSAASAQSVVSAVLSSLAGVALGFAIWIVFWLLGLLGAGDVKFFAAAGAWLGPGGTWRAALVAALLGGVLAVIALLRERRLKAGLERTALALSSRTLGVLTPTPSAEPSHAKQHLPYGVALAGGALVAAWLPNILA